MKGEFNGSYMVFLALKSLLHVVVRGENMTGRFLPRLSIQLKVIQH
jgi:hypothetical protein